MCQQAAAITCILRPACHLISHLRRIQLHRQQPAAKGPAELLAWSPHHRHACADAIESVQATKDGEQQVVVELGLRELPSIAQKYAEQPSDAQMSAYALLPPF